RRERSVFIRFLQGGSYTKKPSLSIKNARIGRGSSVVRTKDPSGAIVRREQARARPVELGAEDAGFGSFFLVLGQDDAADEIILRVRPREEAYLAVAVG